MRNTLIAMSCLVTVSMFACTSSPKRVVQTGTAGAPGSAGAGSAGAGSAGDTGGSAGSVGGTAGSGTAGAAVGGTAGAGTAGAGTAGAGTAGDQGTAGAVGGTAGAGTAGDQGGTAGAAVVMTCMNSTVVSAGGTEANCGTKANWVATAMPTPASGLDGIMNTLLQPQYAIDSNPATRYSSGATMADGFYFQVDLGATKMVSGIAVDTSEGADITDVANGYEVDLSTDGTTFTKIIGCAFPAAPLETINFTATSARYVRYMDLGPPSNGGTSWLSIHEFDILCN